MDQQLQEGLPLSWQVLAYMETWMWSANVTGKKWSAEIPEFPWFDVFSKELFQPCGVLYIQSATRQKTVDGH